MYYVNEDIKKCQRIFPEQGRTDYMRLDMNENPEGLPQEVVDRIKEAITPAFLAQYPEQDVFEQKYAELLGVKQSNIVTTNGSDSAIRYVLQTFGEKGKEVVTVSPSFEMYMVNCWLLGLEHKPVPYEDDLTICVDKIVEAITENTRIVVLLNPNNPLGNVFSEEEVEAVILKAREVGAVVVIDEAYHYFYEGTYLNMTKKYDNVMVLRTFSKCLSVAGVRLGAVIGNEELVGYVRNLRLSFEVNTVALKCGEIILDTPGLIDELKRIEREGKEYFLNFLEENGYESFPCEGNFVFFKPKTSVKGLEAALRENKILVKTYSGELLKPWIRINTASKNILEQFAKAVLELDK